MDDILIFAEDQGITQVHAQLDHLLFLIGLAQGTHQRGQQFHLDEHIPADAVLMLHIPDIITVNHIGMTLDIQHQGVLPGNIFQIAPEMGGQTGIVITLAAQFLDLILALGNGQNLQRRGFDLTEHLPLNFIHRAEAALADFPYNFPAGP